MHHLTSRRTGHHVAHVYPDTLLASKDLMHARHVNQSHGPLSHPYAVHARALVFVLFLNLELSLPTQHWQNS